VIDFREQYSYQLHFLSRLVEQHIGFFAQRVTRAIVELSSS